MELRKELDKITRATCRLASIEGKCRTFGDCVNTPCQFVTDNTDQIINKFIEAGGCLKDENQKLPENPYQRSLEEEGYPEDVLLKRVAESNVVIWDDAQKVLLDSNFKRVVEL